MTCDSCGYVLDPLGDDEMDDSVLEEIKNGLSAARPGHIKASCPNCGHVQYNYGQRRVINGNKRTF
jgi:rubredoxin